MIEPTLGKTTKEDIFFVKEMVGNYLRMRKGFSATSRVHTKRANTRIFNSKISQCHTQHRFYHKKLSSNNKCIILCVNSLVIIEAT